MKKIRIYLELNQLNFDQEKNNIIKNNNNLSIDHLDQQVKISLQHQTNLFNYLNSVMRQKVNDEIAVFDGISGEFIARIIAVEKKSITLKIIKKISDLVISSNITLAFAIIKNNHIDEIASKASELGINQFQPIITKHCVVDKFNHSRFLANVIESCEQCERNDLPKILPIKKLDNFLQEIDQSSLIILADESKNSIPAIKVFNDLKQQNILSKFNKIIIITGPEGGFSSEEFQLLYQQKNLYNISLGKNILRVETAITASIALVNQLLI